MRETPPSLEKRRQPGRIRAILLAVVVHAAFFALIVFGVTWQSKPTAPLQAELWDKLPPANTPTPPAVPPEPAKAEPPKPEAKPDPPKPDPAIAERKEREKREREKLEKLEKKKQEDEARKKREQEDAARKKRDDDKRRLEEAKAKLESEKAREAAAAAKQAEFNRYVDAIRAKIRGKANVPDNVSGQPEVQVRIRILPGGDVLDIAIARSSGNRAYDAAIERAIRSAQPLPVPAADSELFPQFRDLILHIRHER